ncbi:MAG: hypothetical protein KF726_24530 [Anaerolineae bacterium]|nr:hypothetical protein [Anaerolineae bacterium]
MVEALNTFGAILTYAANMEESLAHYYAQAQQVSEGEAAERFEDYGRKSTKRKGRLTAMRQENVTEIVLEPISGLNISDYDLPAPQPATAAEALAAAIDLETRVQKFYAEAGPKINVTEPRRAFAKFAQETAERLEELQG